MRPIIAKGNLNVKGKQVAELVAVREAAAAVGVAVGDAVAAVATTTAAASAVRMLRR